MTTFRYFADPHTSTASTWTDEPRECGLCGETRSGYDGPYYGTDDVEFVCEQCLVSGRIAERGLSTNSGDVGPSDDRRAELEQRTPLLVTWQDLTWPVHCEDFCRFDREVGERELDELADGDAVPYLNAHLAEAQRDFPLDADEVPDRAPNVRGKSTDPAIYQFTCVVCGEHVFAWDAS